MCGIAGVVGEVNEMNLVLSRMAKAQAHRGTDTRLLWSEMFVDSQIGLAHNRMKITDLSDDSNQPFTDKETGLTIVLDGKIFNYKALRTQLKKYYTFTSEGHAEVLLKAYHRWGYSCLSKLIGIFAFAIYDRSGRYLFLARDRFGVKPLYFSIQRGNLYFASEIKALFAAGIYRRFSAREIRSSEVKKWAVEYYPFKDKTKLPRRTTKTYPACRSPAVYAVAASR